MPLLPDFTVLRDWSVLMQKQMVSRHKKPGCQRWRRTIKPCKWTIWRAPLYLCIMHGMRCSKDIYWILTCQTLVTAALFHERLQAVGLSATGEDLLRIRGTSECGRLWQWRFISRRYVKGVILKRALLDIGNTLGISRDRRDPRILGMLWRVYLKRKLEWNVAKTWIVVISCGLWYGVRISIMFKCNVFA